MIGIDIVEASRLERELEAVGGLQERLFSPEELDYAERQPDRILHLAGIFAAKEAVIKALGLLHPALSAKQIKIAHREDGAPVVELSEGLDPCIVSISHDAGVAVAVALAGANVGFSDMLDGGDDTP